MKRAVDKKIGLASLQTGATLVELMVSVFVFAIGVLGFSALQTRSLQATYDNAQREDAAWIADSLIGRIRVNNFASSDYVDEINAFGAECPANPPATLCAEQQGGGAVAACTESELAAYDVWDVLCNTATAGGAIANTGGMDTIKDLAVTLTCADSVGGDADACSTGSDLTLNLTWCAKTVESDIGSDDCSQVWSQQSHTLVFRP